MAIQSESLQPIKISLAAPSGGGKTTLIATILQDTAAALPNTFKVYPATAADKARIEQFNLQLMAAVRSGGFTFKPDTVQGTTNIVINKFNIAFESIIQPFSLMDIPGGWVNPEQRDPDQWQRFEEHLQESIALWVPIDTTLLYEAKAPEEIKIRDMLLNPTDVRDIIDMWAKFRDERKDEPAILCFVPIKCETYLSQAANEAMAEDVFNTFKRVYAEAITDARDFCPHSNIYYAPVETIGNITLKKILWNTPKKERQFILIKIIKALFTKKMTGPVYVSYKMLKSNPSNAFSTGIETITAPVYGYGAECINSILTEKYQKTADERNKKQEAFDNRNLLVKFTDLFGGKAKKQGEIQELNGTLETYHNDLQKLSQVLTGLSKRLQGSPYFKEL